MDFLDKLRPLALFLLRCALGIIFIAHGYPKLFSHTAQAMQGFERSGLPGYAVYGIGALEFFGGWLLVVGLGTRVIGLLLVGEMVVAIWKVKFRSMYVVSDFEFEMALAAAAFALAAIGAGALSLDHLLFGASSKPRSKPDKK
jgi:putative oxidoreductase